MPDATADISLVLFIEQATHLEVIGFSDFGFSTQVAVLVLLLHQSYPASIYLLVCKQLYASGDKCAHKHAFEAVAL